MQLSFENHLEVSTGSEVILSGITSMQAEWMGLGWQLHSPFPALLYLLVCVFLIIPSSVCPPAPFLPKCIKLMFAVIFSFKDC